MYMLIDVLLLTLMGILTSRSKALRSYLCLAFGAAIFYSVPVEARNSCLVAFCIDSLGDPNLEPRVVQGRSTFPPPSREAIPSTRG